MTAEYLSGPSIHADRRAGERAERVLRWIGVSRREAAKEIGVSLSLVAMMAGGESPVRRVVALAMETQFGIRAEYILNGERPVFLRPPGAETLRDESLAVAHGYERLRSVKEKRAFCAALRGLSLAAKR